MFPLKEQSFRDDFAYAWSVKNFVETGHLKISEWSSASDIVPTYWGWLWSELFGFSFGTLHAANYSLLVIGILAYFGLLMELGLDKKRALIFSLWLLGIPWILNFTMSYMTDVPAMSLSIVAIYFLFKGMRKNSFWLTVIGGIVIGLTFLTRQIGIGWLVGMVAVGLWMWLKHRRISGGWLVAIIVSVAMILAYANWLNQGDNKTLGQYYYVDKLTIRGVCGKLLPIGEVSWKETVVTWLLLYHRLVFYFSQILVFSLPITLPIVTEYKRFLKRQTVFYGGIVLGYLTLVYLLDLILNSEGYTAGYPLAAFEIVPFGARLWPVGWKYLLGIGIIIWSIIGGLTLTAGWKLCKLTKKRLLIGVGFTIYVCLTVTNVWHWPQYAIQLYPWIGIFLTMLYKKSGIALNKFSMIVVVLLLGYSTLLARGRYQLGGDVWRVCESLIDDGYRAGEVNCNGQYAHRFWHEFEIKVAKQVKEVGRKEFIENNNGAWSDVGSIEKKVTVEATKESIWPLGNNISVIYLGEK